jgi:uncharacterized membrane protein
MVFLSFFMILLSMLVIDGVWLSVMFKPFYGRNIGHLLADSLSFSAAFLFYILYGIGINVFVVLPALRNGASLSEIIYFGFLFGVVTYATYDLTNQATLRDWPWVVTVVDIIWGGVLVASVSLISTLATRYGLASFHS